MGHTFMGGYLENGACPWASSNAVMPNDQTSALFISQIMKIKGITKKPMKHF